MIDTQQIEQFAQRIWSNRSFSSIAKIAEQYGPIDKDLDWKEWDSLPETLKDHLRVMAEKEVQLLQGPESEIGQYLITMLRELERLRPTELGATSHGIVWDDHWDRLALLVNCGDCVYVHPLRPGDLTGDPIRTAASLAANVEPEIDKPDADVIGFKR